MGTNTGIEWADHTLNFWIGCTEVSPACDFCYAREQQQDRFKRVKWGGPRLRTSATTWRAARKWEEFSQRCWEREGRPHRVFVDSLSDFFDNQVDPQWRVDAWDVVREREKLIFMFLTKRPQNIAKMLPPFWDEIKHRCWIGHTAENQEELERRYPHLHNIDCAVRFLSCEPLLGPLSFKELLGNRINWVIGGGESGSNARVWHPDWRDDLWDWCAAQATPFFWKQHGEWMPVGEAPENHTICEHDGKVYKGEDLHVFDDRQAMIRIGKHLAGAKIGRSVVQEVPREAFVKLW